MQIKSEFTLTETQLLPNGITASIADAKNKLKKEIYGDDPTFANGVDDTNCAKDGNPYDSDDNGMAYENDDAKNIADQVETELLEANDGENLESFQLNSITGNVLSLEQEAYGLLETKTQTTCKVVKERRFKCPECPKTYITRGTLRVHLGVHRTVEKRALGVIRGIQARKKTMKMRRKIRESNQYDTEDVKPLQSKKDGYECTCGKIFQRRSRMETCLRSHDLFETNSKYYPCASCNKKFRSKEELALHRKRLHSKKFPCKFCPTDYESKKELFKHLQIHQKVQLMEYKVISEIMKGKQKLQCFMCSKTWAVLSELKTHVMNVHKGPYVCPHCKNTFPKIIDFCNHTKTYHPEVEGQSVLDVLEAFSRLVQAWKCEECELQFLEADKLALHQIEKHSPDLKPESQVQCTDCRRVFISQKSLTSHRRVHHNPEGVEETKELPEGVMCLECRKMCKDFSALTSHLRFHSLKRKFPCKYCDFRFATQEKRKVHAEIHTGDMKYVCFICEYQCSSENRLKQHKMSLKHANMKEYLLTGKPLVEESTSKQDKIKRTLRKKEWTIKKKKKDVNDKETEKDRDNDSSSSEAEEVACDICGDKFSGEKAMLEHKQTHPFIEFPNDDKPSRIFFK